VSLVRGESFRRLLARSEREAVGWFESMEPWSPPSPRGFYPARTLRTLHLAAVTRFQSGVILLRRPTLAWSASDQVRALVELFAHCAWIAGAGGLSAPMSGRARAICVELGMAKALVDELELLESTVGISFPTGYVADKRWLVQHFAKLHAHHECACRGAGRSFRSVRETLRALSVVNTSKHFGRAKLIYGLWLTSSRAAHFPRLEHIAADAAGGAAVSPATTSDRAITLHNLVMIQSYIATFAATPFARQRNIAGSAYLLLHDIEARTRVFRVAEMRSR